MPAAKAVFEDNELSVVFSSIGGRFEGKAEDGRLTGQWSQGDAFPLTLTRQDGIPEELKKSLGRRMKGEVTDVAGYWSGYLGGETGLFLIL